MADRFRGRPCLEHNNTMQLVTTSNNGDIIYGVVGVITLLKPPGPRGGVALVFIFFLRVDVPLSFHAPQYAQAG